MGSCETLCVFKKYSLVEGIDMKNQNGMEFSPKNPGWLATRVPTSYNDENLMRIIMFYVINTPCADLSARGIELSKYGWDSSIWRNDKLKKQLFDVAGIKRNESFIAVKKLDEIKEACKKINLAKGFQRDREKERLVIYKPSKYNEFLAICYHVRNSLAHGRLAMYPIKDSEDIMFVMEDGVARAKKFQVRARMVLKKSTLLEWIDILEKGSVMV